MLYGLYSVWCCIAVCSYSAVWRCIRLYGCMAPGGRRDKAWCMYGATYSEIQRNTAEFHTACHTALSRMPRQRRVAWMCPSRSTCCHGCWVSPNTFSDPVFAHRDAIRMCLSAPFGAINFPDSMCLLEQLTCRSTLGSTKAEAGQKHYMERGSRVPLIGAPLRWTREHPD